MSTGPSNNDFTIRIANVNGTGSASANALLMKSIFRMGIPVVGKNYFPSNIQGLPTWYEIRVSGRGYMARAGRIDIMLAMNAQTYRKDLADVAPGGYLIYDSTWPRHKLLNRDDVTIIGIPLARMCNEQFSTARSRVLMKNVAYVGAVAALLDVDLDVIKASLEKIFAKKASLLKANYVAFNLGYDYAKQHFGDLLSFKVEPMDETSQHIMIDGNTATALGAVYAGATVGAWYPLTPSTSVMDTFISFCERYRIEDETGQAKYCIIQAEDELSAMGMVLGAGWNGARAFTPTSGPGISLMSELLGYGYFAEIPAVVVNVQRCGPSTGMPTRTQQADIMACAYASHGDTRHVLLFPSSPEECFYHSVAAFDLAERLQTPVIILTDLDIGMNDWMIPILKWDDNYKPDRGKSLDAAALEKMESFHRYLDVDDDAIPYRTFPGEHPNGAYFTRGSGHNMYGAYTEDSNEYLEVVDRLRRKWETAKQYIPEPAVDYSDKYKVGIISVGSCDGAVIEARDRLLASGMGTNYLRVKAFPFTDRVQEFIDSHDRLYVVEQNRDAQLRSLLMLETDVVAEKLVPLLFYDGLPINARGIIEAINQDLAKGVAA
ncbi:MAG: 2-oxoacid:acceptor oxidoreductase subunit alpha [Gammaproteobacteria bacterium]|nr:ferredoxin oxidoreductase [Chromatiales bacterium]MDP6675354.1 2-oxoacid:acceptor oxidoreductase subunit alpha [Gammaproteobacteria bacterium]